MNEIESCLRGFCALFYALRSSARCCWKDYVTADEAAGSIKLCRSALTTYANCQYAFWQTGASKPTWKSSNTSVATIDSNGIMTGKSAGTTTITPNFTDCGIGQNRHSQYLNKRRKWFSSNTNVVTVSNGVVTAKAIGYATISAYTTQGASTCLIKVRGATPR